MRRSTALAGVSALLMSLLSFFGTNTLFGPLQMVSILLFLSLVGLLLARTVSGLWDLVAGRGLRLLLQPLGTLLVLVAVLAAQPTVHEFGLRFLIACHRETLDQAAQEVLATSRDEPEDRDLWQPTFDIWPTLLGPGRRAAWREGELLFLDVEGAPHASVGLCYNPRHLEHKACTTPLGGAWYRFHS